MNTNRRSRSAPLSRLLARAGLSLALAGVAHAQEVSAAAFAFTDLVAHSGSGSSSVPAGSPLDDGTSVVAWNYSSSARTDVSIAVIGSSTVRYDIRERCESHLTAAWTGSHQTRLVLDSTAPVTGLLTARVVGTGSYEVAIDVGNDGTVETTFGTWWARHYHQELTISGPTAIRTITAAGIAGSSLDGDVTLEISFEPYALIHDNGPLVTHAGAGVGGADVSARQNVPPLNLNGYGTSCSAVDDHSLADDFVVGDPGGWSLQAVELFAYQTNSTTASTIISLNVRIYVGDPSAGGVLHPSSPGFYTPSDPSELLTTGALANEWSGVYRTSLDDVGSATARPVMRIRAALPEPIYLPAGRYWIEFTMAGYEALGRPYVPHLSVLGKGDTGNALKRRGSVWSPLLVGPDERPQGLPFRLFGRRSDAMGSIETTVPGCGSAHLSVRGAPVLGGFFLAELTDRTPGTIGLIGLDATPAAIPVCGCTAGHQFAFLLLTDRCELNVPPDLALRGASIYTQGVEFGVPGCGFLPIELTETVRMTFR